ncbi:MAG: hypothetical protein R3E86_05535 [Pseudomonadales bacterium]
MTETTENERLIQYYREAYFHELDRKDAAMSRLQGVSSLVLVEIGFLGYVISRIEPHDLFELSLVSGSFWMMCASIICAVWFLAHGFLFQTYELVPYLDETEEYRATLLRTYAKFEHGDNLARKYFDEFQISYLSDCASQIGRTNTKRHRIAHLSLVFVFVFTLPALLSVGILFVHDRLGDPPSVGTSFCQKVCEPEILMIEGEDNETQPEPPPPPPPPPPKRLERGEKPIDTSRPPSDSDGD